MNDLDGHLSFWICCLWIPPLISSWPDLQTQHNISRLQIFYKAFHNQIPLSISTNYPEKPGNIISCFQQHLQHHTKKTFSRTVQEWNSLPQFLIELDGRLMEDSLKTHFLFQITERLILEDSFSISNYCTNVNV